ncbi:hypothetical protein SAMN06295912_15014 [Sphingomonas laterariae]|uniref:Uncharacterized protein n=2 Tax=Edaphosphingomonas laterariae TaxID=861865 RepID=A0A239KDY3_9SPHN|nr:hypothetical protein SAMN06295912_15014 [Sphingomonas laterariae]
MTQRSSVVPETSSVGEDQFHGAMLAGLGRAERKVGLKVLAFVMDMTPKGLRNLFAGSAPHPKRLWDALYADKTALDDIADLYGRRVVDKTAVCDTDDLKVLIARVNLKLQEYAHPDSPAAESTAHCEYLDGEALMRSLHHETGRWLERCSEIRKPRAVA